MSTEEHTEEPLTMENPSEDNDVEEAQDTMQQHAVDPAPNSKYGGNLANRPIAVSSFLQKRLQKGQKFFDSGDYNVARSMKKPPGPQGFSSQTPIQQRNMTLLIPPSAEDNPMPVLTPEDLPHHTHAHETSKLVTDQIHPTT